jgi:outer membrane receptor protein involved in Fe transport
VFRISGGTAFRNPTLLENYVSLQQRSPNPGTQVPNPPFSETQFSLEGNQDLDPERLHLLEVAHTMRVGWARTHAVGFHYRLDQIISTSPIPVMPTPPVFESRESFVNDGELHAWGGELGLDLQPWMSVGGFVNYSYQWLNDRDDSHTALQSPKHKFNVGTRYRTGRFSSDVSAHWVDETRWPAQLGVDYPTGYGVVDPYVILNAGTRYRPAQLEGVEFIFSAFNLANNRHYEILPAAGLLAPGQGGERIGRRLVATIEYAF